MYDSVGMKSTTFVPLHSKLCWFCLLTNKVTRLSRLFNDWTVEFYMGYTFTRETTKWTHLLKQKIHVLEIHIFFKAHI